MTDDEQTRAASTQTHGDMQVTKVLSPLEGKFVLQLSQAGSLGAARRRLSWHQEALDRPSQASRPQVG